MINLPPHVFCVTLKCRTWLSPPDWECTMAHGDTHSQSHAPTANEAYVKALALAERFIPKPRIKTTNLLDQITLTL